MASYDNTTLRLDLDNEPQPDVLLRILPENGGSCRVTPDQYLEGPPEFVAEIVVKAREQLRGLLGREPESVSGIERTNGHWSVTIEVIELHRIPDSTDVLASYELVLDDDGNVARMVRRRRYLRSQIEARS